MAVHPKRFLYYLPGSEPVTAGRLRAAGLAERFDSEGSRGQGSEGPGEDAAADPAWFGLVRSQALAKGPDGGPGQLVALGDPVPLYEPGKQSWADEPGFWIGHYADALPGPAELKRETTLRAVPLALADGHDWLVPVATLQPTVRRRAGGKWIDAPNPRYAAAWQLAERLREKSWDAVDAANVAWAVARQALDDAMTAAGITFDPDKPGDAARALTKASHQVQQFDALQDAVSEAWEAAKAATGTLDPDDTAAILGLGYRVGPAEVAALGLLEADATIGNSTDWQVLDAFVDGPGIRAARAKKDSPPSSDG